MYCSICFGLIDVPGLGVFDSRDGTLPERVDEGTAQASVV